MVNSPHPENNPCWWEQATPARQVGSSCSRQWALVRLAGRRRLVGGVLTSAVHPVPDESQFIGIDPKEVTQPGAKVRTGNCISPFPPADSEGIRPDAISHLFLRPPTQFALTFQAVIRRARWFQVGHPSTACSGALLPEKI